MGKGARELDGLRRRLRLSASERRKGSERLLGLFDLNCYGLAVVLGVGSVGARGGGALELYLLVVKLAHVGDFWVCTNAWFDSQKQERMEKKIGRK